MPAVEHGVVAEQRVDKYTTNNIDYLIHDMIRKGWKVLTMASTDRGEFYVVYERYTTSCGLPINCLSCLAGT